MTADFEPGQVFGKFTLLERIGVGGMAEIYKARIAGPDGFAKVLVVKKILPAHAKNRAFVRMLVAEAKLTSMLQHPNVVQIYELGEIDGQWYIAMEYVQGPDLLRILTASTKRKKRLPPELAVHLIAEVCKGLEYAHTAKDTDGRPLKIIHRDVSPSNVLVSFQGAVKIMDFGVARADLESGNLRQTVQGVMKGKLGYMSPEQIAGEGLDHRSDLFALGIVLFEVLTLKRLFMGSTEVETLLNIRDVRIDKKLARHDYIPADIQQILRKALSKDPQDRFQTAGEFQDALLDYLFEQRVRVSSRRVASFLAGLFGDEAKAPLMASVSSSGLPAQAKAVQKAAEAAVGADSEHEEADTVADLEAAMNGEPETAQDGAESGLTDHEELETAPDLERDADLGLDAGDPEGGEPAASDLETVEDPYEDPPTEPQLPDNTDVDAPPESDTAAPAPSTHITRATFRLQQPGGFIFGPVTFNNLVNLLKTRSISGRELVSVDGAEWLPIRELSAIRQLEPGIFDEELEDPRKEGPLSRLLTPQLLYRLSVAKASGRLRLTRGGNLKEVYFQQGVPVHVSSNLKDELLGEYMRRQGLIDDAQLAAAVESVRTHGGRVGDAVVRLGILGHHDLFRILEDQFRQKLLEVFTWRDGWYQFYDGHMPPSDIVWMSNDMAGLLAAGVRNQFSLDELEQIFAPYAGWVLTHQRNPHITHANLRFTSRELRFYTYMESGLTLGDLAAKHGTEPDDRKVLLQVLFVLHQTDLIALHKRAPQKKAS